MAFAIAATPDVGVFSVVCTATSGDKNIKRTPLDGAIDDTHILQIAEDFDALTNAHMDSPSFASRPITGQKSAAVDALQNRISEYMVLTFGRTDAVSGKDVTMNFIVPAYVQAGVVTGTPPIPNVGTPGTGSLSARLGRLVANLEDALAKKQADDTWLAGGFTYLSGAFGTAADLLDGV